MRQGPLKTHCKQLNPILIDEYIQQQIQELLYQCQCQLVKGKDYEIEAAANAVNGLVGDNSTADIYLYAAIERRDWPEVIRIYEGVFRPYLLQTATQSIETTYMRTY